METHLTPSTPAPPSADRGLPTADSGLWTVDCGLRLPPPEGFRTPHSALRTYQAEALAAFTQARFRLFCLLWERQSGKSSTFADMTLFDMMQRPWRTCIYASASLLLAQELPIKQSQRLHLSSSQLIQKDSATLQAAALHCSSRAASAGLLFHTADAAKDKILPALDPDAFAELFQAQKLEFRVYHDKSSYSRTKIIAPSLATARSWTGSVFLDEIAFIRDLKHLIVALLPVISTNPDLKLILATTPPEFDDSHYSFELLAPPPALAFTPNPAGNWYESQSQIPVHRADAFDTHLAGKKIFDLRSGNETTPAEALRLHGLD